MLRYRCPFFARAVEDALTRFQLRERGDAWLMRQPAPMLLGRAKELFDDPDWTYELKWDGFRVLATVRRRIRAAHLLKRALVHESLRAGLRLRSTGFPPGSLWYHSSP